MLENIVIMLNKNFYYLPMWVWIVGIVAIVFVYYNKAKKSEHMADTVTTPSKPVVKILNFNTRWCGWSQRLQPDWDAFTKAVAQDPTLKHIQVQDVKCEDGPNEAMCNKYNVPGYPYIVVEKTDGSTKPYEGDRSANALLSFVQTL